MGLEAIKAGESSAQASVEHQASAELYTIKAEIACQTEVSMSDLQLFLDFKRRAILKIEALEKDVANLKT